MARLAVRIGVLGVVSLGLAACGIFGPDFRSLAAAAKVNPDSLVVRGSLAYGLRDTANLLEVVAISSEGDVRMVASRTAERSNSTSIASGGGKGEVESCCVFVYGTAGPNVVKVEVQSLQGNGTAVVHAGAWLVLLPVNDVDPPQVAWTFVGANEAVVEQGAGPRTVP